MRLLIKDHKMYPSVLFIKRSYDDGYLSYCVGWFFKLGIIAGVCGIISHPGSGLNLGYSPIWWLMVLALHPILVGYNYVLGTDDVPADIVEETRQVRLIPSEQGREIGNALLKEISNCKDLFPEKHRMPHRYSLEERVLCPDCTRRTDLIVKLKGVLPNEAVESANNFLASRKELGV